MSVQSNSSQKAWSNYWNKGFLSTFGDGKQDNYKGRIKDYWETNFLEVPNGGTIVDLGAGNGAILALALEFSQQRDSAFKLVAVDYADITVASEFYTHFPEIELRANTKIEKTGIKSNSVDLCVSQFGFEYADTVAASKEIARILKPGCSFKALMHHHLSSVTLSSQSAVQQATLCRRSELTKTTGSLLRRLQKLKKNHRDAKNDEKAFELRDRFNRMAARLKQYSDNLPDNDHITYFLNELGNLFGHQAEKLSLNDKIAIVRQVEIDTVAYLSRMRSMVNASSDRQKIEFIAETFRKLGMHVKPVNKLTHKDQTLSWVFSATNPD